MNGSIVDIGIGSETQGTPIKSTQGIDIHRSYDISGLPHSINITTAGDVATGAPQRTERRFEHYKKLPKWQKRKIQERERKSITLYLSNLVESIEEALAAEEAGDAIPKSNAVSEFADTLKELWVIREAREENFAITVNMLQTVLSDIAIELVSAEFLAVLCDIAKDMAASSYVSDEALERYTAQLERIDIDPFKALW